MNLEQIRANFGILLNEANKKGAFDLEQANMAIQSLMVLDNFKKETEQRVKELEAANYELHKRVAELEATPRPQIDPTCTIKGSDLVKSMNRKTTALHE